MSLAKASAKVAPLSLRSEGTRMATRGTGVAPDSTTMRCVAKINFFICGGGGVKMRKEEEDGKEEEGGGRRKEVVVEQY